MVRALWAGALIVSALAVLTWCSGGYVRANPLRRLPGRLPEAQQPPGYMAAGILGIVLGVAGAFLATGGATPVGWLLAAVVIAAGLLPLQLIHNRHLRK